MKRNDKIQNHFIAQWHFDFENGQTQKCHKVPIKRRKYQQKTEPWQQITEKTAHKKNIHVLDWI